MARNIDFAFLFRGGANDVLLPFKLENLTDVAIDTKPYEAAKRTKNSKRLLFTLSTGAGDAADRGALSAHLDQLMDLIRTATDRDFSKIGAFVIVGSSNGASLALALAAELSIKGAPKLGYVGVCNVNITPGGRDPIVPNIGDLKPVQKPTFSKLKNKAALPGQHPDLAEEEAPFIILETKSISADKKRNFFEKQGNHAKYFRKPPGNKFFPGWWWHSSMPGNNEVHGEVEGFDNKPFVVTGADDFAKHNAICTGAPFNEMLKEAADALANFPV